MAQVFEGRRRSKRLDLLRCARTGVAGFVLHGPALHFWILFLDGPFSSFVGSSDAWYVIVAKVALDQSFFAVTLNTVFLLLLGSLGGKSSHEVLTRIRETLPLAMFSSWRFWPFVHLVTYSPSMPQEFKVLWNDAAEIVWVIILSVIAHDEKQKHPEQLKAAAEVALLTDAEKRVQVK